jgi:hypothetical protein
MEEIISIGRYCTNLIPFNRHLLKKDRLLTTTLFSKKLITTSKEVVGVDGNPKDRYLLKILTVINSLSNEPIQDGYLVS